MVVHCAIFRNTVTESRVNTRHASSQYITCDHSRVATSWGSAGNAYCVHNAYIVLHKYRMLCIVFVESVVYSYVCRKAAQDC